MGFSDHLNPQPSNGSGSTISASFRGALAQRPGGASNQHGADVDSTNGETIVRGYDQPRWSYRAAVAEARKMKQRGGSGGSGDAERSLLGGGRGAVKGSGKRANAAAVLNKGAIAQPIPTTVQTAFGVLTAAVPTSNIPTAVATVATGGGGGGDRGGLKLGNLNRTEAITALIAPRVSRPAEHLQGQSDTDADTDNERTDHEEAMEDETEFGDTRGARKDDGQWEEKGLHAWLGPALDGEEKLLTQEVNSTVHSSAPLWHTDFVCKIFCVCAFCCSRKLFKPDFSIIFFGCKGLPSNTVSACGGSSLTTFRSFQGGSHGPRGRLRTFCQIIRCHKQCLVLAFRLASCCDS